MVAIIIVDRFSTTTGIYSPIGNVTFRCVLIEAYRLHGLLNPCTTRCGKMFENKETTINEKKYIFFQRFAMVSALSCTDIYIVLFYFACTSNTCVAQSDYITSALFQTTTALSKYFFEIRYRNII